MQSWLIMDYCDKGSLLEAIDKGWFQIRTSKVGMSPQNKAADLAQDSSP